LKLAFNRYCLHRGGSKTHPIVTRTVVEGRGFRPKSFDELHQQIIL
jgi:hypothetical protein